MKAAENEPVHDICHTLRQALAPGETLLQNNVVDTDEGTDDEESGIDDGVIDEEAAAEAMNALDDDAQRIVTPNDIDEDINEDMAAEEEVEGDISATARQMTADIHKHGYNLLTQVNLLAKGSAQLKKDGIKKKRVGGRQRLERKLALTRAIARAELACQSEQNWAVEDEEVEVQDNMWTRMAKRTSKFA